MGWWQPHTTELVYERNELHICMIENIKCNGLYLKLTELEGISEKEDLIPLLTETQLRHFIKKRQN